MPSKTSNTMHSTPNVVHCFYTDDRRLTWAEARADGAVETFFLQLTGLLSSKIIGKRNFVHGFFLAPQAKGYYVLTDIFRYLDEEPIASKSLAILANGISESTPVIDEPLLLWQNPQLLSYLRKKLSEECQKNLMHPFFGIRPLGLLCRLHLQCSSQSCYSYALTT
ncbi:hypothetical protein AXG93_2960s1280 [Marchantia polymorpha subsp. ruderalis]|uniref:NTF2 domain-containing protein n=1 Tax=Marchantia polymorpha subsp. ruderalis TaxID=1480154 RepID=A0A176W7I8_MARPO|nr:hypothetical protein AXG93_2960s1280 [Marchantia polymorpha subsp. ruderalis]